MSDLKDRFAMAAMVAILRRENKPLDYLDVARMAYKCAEYMVGERQKQIDLAALNEKRNNSDTQVCIRHVPVGHKFLLIRTNEEYTMVEIKRKTPSGTQYVVQKQNETKNSSLHHSCHVVLFGKTWNPSTATT